jgi:hypothetical protein
LEEALLDHLEKVSMEIILHLVQLLHLEVVLAETTQRIPVLLETVVTPVGLVVEVPGKDHQEMAFLAKATQEQSILMFIKI